MLPHAAEDCHTHLCEWNPVHCDWGVQSRRLRLRLETQPLRVCGRLRGNIRLHRALACAGHCSVTVALLIGRCSWPLRPRSWQGSCLLVWLTACCLASFRDTCSLLLALQPWSVPLLQLRLRCVWLLLLSLPPWPLGRRTDPARQLLRCRFGNGRQGVGRLLRLLRCTLSGARIDRWRLLL
jgi:hypothetical protein